MRIYGVKYKTLQSGLCLWQDAEDALEEIRSHLEQGETGDVIEVIITEMSEEDYNTLPEFEGY